MRVHDRYSQEDHKDTKFCQTKWHERVRLRILYRENERSQYLVRQNFFARVCTSINYLLNTFFDQYFFSLTRMSKGQ